MTDKRVKNMGYPAPLRWVLGAIMRLLGWKFVGTAGDVRKSVLIAAPHESNWDLFLALYTLSAFDAPAPKFMMKKFWFFWPLGVLWRALGGVPVDRARALTIVSYMVRQFNEQECMTLAVTPEGTRKQVEYWKLGFYMIARDAGVPIFLCYVNRKEKTLDATEVFYPTDDMDADLNHIADYYEKHIGVRPKFRK